MDPIRFGSSLDGGTEDFGLSVPIGLHVHGRYGRRGARADLPVERVITKFQRDARRPSDADYDLSNNCWIANQDGKVGDRDCNPKNDTGDLTQTGPLRSFGGLSSLGGGIRLARRGGNLPLCGSGRKLPFPRALELEIACQGGENRDRTQVAHINCSEAVGTSQIQGFRDTRTSSVMACLRAIRWDWGRKWDLAASGSDVREGAPIGVDGMKAERRVHPPTENEAPQVSHASLSLLDPLTGPYGFTACCRVTP
ncbi:hypothetical protein DFH06DRAFT_1139454 [Mycena polygramma]|nr:hypothetical protein DFH06DRAFT_1139454 [Mycena polygramma]